MATTINSGYANSPKLTANIADHADVYGGRALVFDGAIDYLDCGNSFESTLKNSFTLSAWIKPTDGQPSAKGSICGTLKYDNYSGYVQFSQETNGKLRLTIGTPTAQEMVGTSSVVFSNGASNWTHVVAVFTKSSATTGTIALYANGEDVSDTTTKGGSWNIESYVNTYNMFIGARNETGTANQLFNGSMADVKFYSSALTEAEVQSQYLKPESVPNQDSLIAWYPMIEGNPESPQSIVYDHSKKGLSEELATSWSSSDTEILNTDGSTITIATNSSGHANIHTNQMIQSGRLYRVSYDYTLNSGTHPFFFTATNGSQDNTIPTSRTMASLGNEWYFVSGSATGFSFWSGSNFSITVNNFSVKEVLMGNHATTKFFGDELVEDGGFATATASSTTGAYWTTQSAWDINTTSSGKAYVNNTGGGNNSITQSSSNGSVSVNPLTAGKTYRTTGTAVISSLDAGTYLNVMSGGGTTKTIVPAGSTGTVNFDEEFVADTGMLQYRMVGVGSLTLDDVTVREVGISSSGFETAVNEPVVPQVPLMKYNQKMITSSTTFANTYVHLPDGLTAGLTEITISLWFQKIQSGNSRVVLFAVDGGGTYFRDIGNNRITCHMPFDNGGNPFSYFDFPSDLAPHHYVFTVKSGSQEVYRDGVLVHSTTVTTTTMSHNIRRIGNYANEQDTSMADEFAIFNKHFTQAEAQELFNDGVALDATTHSKKGNLLAYYRNDGVTTWQDRRGWSALDFDNTGDHIDCGSSSTLKNLSNSAFTASAWVNSALNGQDDIIVGNTWTDAGFHLRVSGTVLRFIILSDSSNYKFSDSGTLNSGWNHVVGTWDGTNIKTFVNGVESTGLNSSGTLSGQISTRNLFIGDNPQTTRAFEGSISSVSLYNVAKSAPEILAIYNAGINSSEASNSNLIGYWKLNTASTDANAIRDLSSNSNHGTVNGNPTLNDGNHGNVQGSPDSITIREGLNTNRDGLGFYFKNPSSNVLRLNGSNDFVTIDSTGSLPSGDQSRSITCWIKPHSLSGDQPIVFTGTYSSNQQFTLAFLSANPTKISVWGHLNDNTGTDVLTTDNWWYVGVTYDSGTNTLKSYIGGGANNINPALDINNTSTTNYNTTYGDIRIGRASTQDKYFDGIVDEVKIYNRALSTDEILKDFKHQKGKHKND